MRAFYEVKYVSHRMRNVTEIYLSKAYLTKLDKVIEIEMLLIVNAWGKEECGDAVQ